MRRFVPAIAALTLITPLSAQRALTATPQLTIDGAEHEFTQLVGLAISPIAVSARGVIAVAGPRDSRVQFFDARGKPLGSFGRAGEGPGEYRMPAMVGWAGDTLTTADAIIRRVTYIGPDFKLLRTVPLPSEILPPRGVEGTPLALSVFPWAASGDGSWIGRAMLHLAPSIPPWFPTSEIPWAAYVRLGPGNRYQKLLAIHGSPVRCHVTTAVAAIVIPLCALPLDEISPNGRHLLAIRPLATGRYRMVAIDGLDGDTVFARQVRYQPRAVPRRVADSIRDARARTIGMPPGLTELWRRAPVAEVYPAVVRAIVGVDGVSYLEEHTLAPAPRRWQVLDRTGAEIGVLTVARKVNLSVVTRDQVWAVVEDDDGLQHIVRYGVR